MNTPLKSSVYVDLLKGVYADVADDLGLDLRRELEKVLRVWDNGGFKAAQRWTESKLESFVVQLKKPTSPEFSGLFQLFFQCTEADGLNLRVRAFAHARQLCYLFRKLEDDQCSETDQQALDAYWSRQDSMETPLTTDQLMLSRELARILPTLVEDLPHLEADWPAPDIGPGASFEKRLRSERPAYFCDSRFRFWAAEYEPTNLYSRACAVPKTWKRRRLIFVEPSSRMLVQKALQAFMYGAASRYPLRSYVNFHDQSFQQEKLRFPGAASIDLSDASDYIDRRIAWLAFSGLPRLRSVLFSARGRGDGLHRNRCFATMGNATTFPVMTLLLTAVLVLCENEANLRLQRGGLPALWKGGVFGDDIVCNEVIYGSVVYILTALGLKINRSKSYVAGPFKESCGLDLLEGVDVTPVKIRSLATVTDDDFVRLCAYTNNLFTAGYWRASDVLLSEILRRWPKTTFGPVGAPDCIWSYTMDDYGPGRWSKPYQRIVPWRPNRKPLIDEVSDDPSNLQFWLAHRRRPSDTYSTF